MIEIVKRVSHAVWRAIVKRERRRSWRQCRARERDLQLQEEESALMQDPTYVAELERQQAIEAETQKLEEEEAAREKLEWQLRDAALHSLFLRTKQRKINEQQQREKQEALIKREWEEKLQKEKEEEDKKKEEQRVLLAAASRTLSKEGEETHNPEPPAGYSRSDFTPQRRESCPFFTRTGACRFGIKCSREHTYPENSRTILLPNMYFYFGLENVAVEDIDADIALEYSESETNQHFKDFFEDTLPEFQRFGNVIQYKVCSNMSTHLRGNVYVQFSREEDAKCAQSAFNGRWYAGRQLTCLLIDIDRWKSAICGLYWRQRCPKGGQCNLLHVHRNPSNAFWRADQDMQQARVSAFQSSTPLHSHRSHSERSSGCSSRRRSRPKSRSDISRSRRDERSGSKRKRSRSRDGSEPRKSKSRISRGSRTRDRSDSEESKIRSKHRDGLDRSNSKSGRIKSRLERSRSRELRSKVEMSTQRENSGSKRTNSRDREGNEVKVKSKRSRRETELKGKSSDEISVALLMDKNSEGTPKNQTATP